MLDTILSFPVTLPILLACTGTSLALGCVTALVFCFRNHYTKSFLLTLILLPVVVQVVITLVNGNLGAGIAVAGAFSLVRFRSMPGTAREICALFQDMMIGMATGMGYIGIAAFAVLILCLVQLIFVLLLSGNGTRKEKSLLITIPENMDYTNIFDDLFEKYTTQHELIKVKTTAMGSLFELSYVILLKDSSKEKEFLDQIRCRNGNLSISCSCAPPSTEAL